MDLISIIVPVYNVQEYLDGCVKSIVNQDYSQLEIILVDDGSTDDSGKICDCWAERDSRVQVLHKSNGGLSDARNAGIDVAHGTYYMFVDSDDTIASDAVHTLYMAATVNHCEIAVCNMVRVYDDGGKEPFYAPVQSETVWRGNDRFRTLKQPSVCNKLFLASLFEGIRFPKGKFYEDTFIYHKLVIQASAIALTGKDGYYYLSRCGSILGRPVYTDRYFDMVESVYIRATDLIRENIPYYGEEACLSLYAVVGTCEKYVPKTAQNKQMVATMRQQYRFAYEQLIHSKNIGLKQKLRLFLLRWCPAVHSKLY